ncbi:hypothetical protein QF049_002434 [Paenibacillus sp. W4I10]|nr:hypothetical protein [Paenibacillus sp. W4I10]RPK30345.1 hypothetical protein EDO6_00972 [Paenibacillus xylanexedens]
MKKGSRDKENHGGRYAGLNSYYVHVPVYKAFLLAGSTG